MAIALVYDNVEQRADLTREAEGTISLDEGLETAVMISLFTDRLATPAQAPNPIDRRGWWGDTHPDVPGDLIGSRLWTLSRSKATTQTLRLSEAYSSEALAWLIQDGVAGTISVVAFYQRRDRQVVLCQTIEIQRPDDPATRWIRTWEITTMGV